MMVVPERLRALVPIETELIILQTIGSTNDYAKELIKKKDIARDTFIIACEQTMGKGTRGRSFYSPKGSGLYLSYITRHSKNGQEIIPPTPAAAVAVKRALECTFSVEPKIKWVNDILIENRKVCGILAERVSDPNLNYEYFVIGIGVNISINSFPKEIENSAASISEFVVFSEIEPFVAEIIKQLTLLVKNPDPNEYLNEYKNASSVIGQRISFFYNGIEKSGLATDITRDSHLIVDTDSGYVELFSGEVSVIAI